MSEAKKNRQLGSRLIFTAAVIFLAILKGPAQENSFFDGEELHYRAFYKLGFIWVHAGDVGFSASDSSFQGKDAWHLRSWGRSLEKYNWVYSVDDNYCSFATKYGLSSLFHIEDRKEGSDSTRKIYRYDHDAGVLLANIKETGKKTPGNNSKSYTLKLEKNVYDVLTAVYRCRELDFAGMKQGEQIPLKMVLDTTIHHTNVRYLGIETIKDRKKKTHDCYSFSILLPKGSLFKGGEELLIWLSRDSRKIPILVKSKVVVGSVNAYFWE